jgi:hypothetical protein
MAAAIRADTHLDVTRVFLVDKTKKIPFNVIICVSSVFIQSILVIR